VEILEARYLMGLPLWVEGDRCDQGAGIAIGEIREWESPVQRFPMLPEATE
jgi:hypothetical protein